ncbi:Protein of unknown function [Cotesia congregata]|uniref:Uncharacterized protein n=1 Tax=Cotesia congregata TaxID=51543 RepID=A0A8J2H9U7_COTCN|nr:Protein of unknown function [Cotesia congregata]
MTLKWINNCPKNKTKTPRQRAPRTPLNSATCVPVTFIGILMEDLNEVNPKNNLVEKEPCNCGDMRCLSKAENPIDALEQGIECLFGEIYSINRALSR